ncbi:MAG: tRNA lysidine(34) synthetase TilS [Roseburia sp.]|nr:tRNA lysidine(34) synthetase TilS [Roseburia sp.]
MFRKFLQYCKREKLIEKDDYVLAGVSGGADSVCMLQLLVMLQKEVEFSLKVIHVEHGIRGEESIQDAVFVEQLCKNLHVPVQVYRVRAIDYAREKKLGLEEAARILRYDCYREAAKEVAGSKVKVALAHHADDNAETVLFQMVRGSGIAGMSGIRPKRELVPSVEVVRPLLTVTRKQIEEYLEKEGLSYCVDSTNTDVTYSRNKIRRHILPMLEEVNVQAVMHINQSAMLLRELDDYIKGQVDNAAVDVLKEQKAGFLILEEKWKLLPEFLKKEMLHYAIGKVAGSRKDVGLEHVELLAGLMELQVGRSISLPYEIRAKRVYEGVLLERRKEAEAFVSQESFFLDLEEQELDDRLQKGDVIIEVPKARMSFSLLEYDDENAEISKNTYTKCFDYDKIKGGFQVRTRQAGDYLIVDDDGHRKRLKEYFINEKIPSDKRDRILLLTRRDKVLWVIGGRISADVKVDGNTRKILKVQIVGGDYYEN